MAYATFLIVDKPTHSSVLVEFTSTPKGKIKVSGSTFVQGKVVDIRAIRECMKHARVVLLGETDPDMPPTG